MAYRPKMNFNHRILLAILIMWLSVSLGAVIPTIEIESNPIVHISPRTEIAPVQTSGGMGTGYIYVLEALLWGMIALAVVGVLIYRRFILQEALSAVVSLFLGFLMVGILLFLSNRFELGIAPEGLGGGGHTTHLISSGNNTYLFVLFSVVLIITVIIFIVKNYRIEKPKEEITRREIREYFEEAIYQVKIGKDVRGAILSAYLEMEKLMKAHGVEDKKYYTPREFKEFAIEQLNIREEPVERLTNLFELARYSRHEMNEEHRKEALNALEEIRNDIEK